jgi:hypothetical protein
LAGEQSHIGAHIDEEDVVIDACDYVFDKPWFANVPMVVQ